MEYCALREIIDNVRSEDNTPIAYNTSKECVGNKTIEDIIRSEVTLQKRDGNIINRHIFDGNVMPDYFLETGEFINILFNDYKDSCDKLLASVDNYVFNMNTHPSKIERDCKCHVRGIYTTDDGVNETFFEHINGQWREYSRTDSDSAVKFEIVADVTFSKITVVVCVLIGPVDYVATDDWTGRINNYNQSSIGMIRKIFSQTWIYDSNDTEFEDGNYLYPPNYVPMTLLRDVQCSELFLLIATCDDQYARQIQTYLPSYEEIKLDGRCTSFYELFNTKYGQFLAREEPIVGIGNELNWAYGKVENAGTPLAINDNNKVIDVFGNIYSNLYEHNNILTKSIIEEWHNEYRRYPAIVNHDDAPDIVTKLKNGLMPNCWCMLDQFYTKIPDNVIEDANDFPDHPFYCKAKGTVPSILVSDVKYIDYGEEIQDSNVRVEISIYEIMEKSRATSLEEIYVNADPESEFNYYYFHLPSGCNVKYMHLFTFYQIHRHIEELRQVLEFDDDDDQVVIVVCIQHKESHRHMFIKTKLTKMMIQNTTCIEDGRKITIKNLVEQEWGFQLEPIIADMIVKEKDLKDY